MKKMLYLISGTLAAIGAINWGLVGLFDVNLVQKLFGTMPHIEKITYILVGVAGLVSASYLFQDYSQID
jgi:uncharacterized membrane protein YuzA (DUF378 family)